MTPGDFGPLYAETQIGRFPVEPWNTFSNLIFLGVWVLFAYRTRFDRKKHPLFIVTLPVLLVGFVGGTVFHATRASNVWLVMDFVPIGILAIAGALYFWLRVVPNAMVAASLFLLTMSFSFAARRLVDLPRHLSISLGYGTLALGVLLPIVLHSRQSNWYGLARIIAAAAFFSIAITFRIVDREIVSLLPMGSHFLWHIFGGLSTYLILDYAYQDDCRRYQRRGLATAAP